MWSCRAACSRASGCRAALLQGQDGLSAIERLDLALLIDRQHDGVGGRIDERPTTSLSLATNSGSLESLKARQRRGWRPCAFQMRRTALALTPTSAAIMSAVQCVVSPVRVGKRKRHTPAR